MTKDEIIRMAREAGFAHSWSEAAGHALERFASLVAAAEREECAKVCDELAALDKLSNYYKVAANAIRARGEK